MAYGQSLGHVLANLRWLIRTVIDKTKTSKPKTSEDVTDEDDFEIFVVEDAYASATSIEVGNVYAAHYCLAHEY